MVTDYTGIACISTMTVDMTGDFSRNNRMSVQKLCDPVLADGVFALRKILHLHLPPTVIFAEMLCHEGARRPE